VTLKSAYENSEISKNMNIVWNNRTGINHNPFLFNASQHGTSIAIYNYQSFVREGNHLSIDFNTYN
jgi:hypothetical protein